MAKTPCRLLGSAVVLWTSALSWADTTPVRTGRAAYTDYRGQTPGTVRRITVADLPEPDPAGSVDNGPSLVTRPADAWPKVPPGFTVELYATGLQRPRALRTAPNGDIFVSESRRGRITVLRGPTGEGGKGPAPEVFAHGLRQPFGLAFHPPGPEPRWLYVGNTDQVVRFAYRNGDRKARGAAQAIAELPGGGLLRGGGHWTRDLAFSRDGGKLYVAIGSRSNVDDTDGNPAEALRANVLEFNPDGSGRRVFAWGLRNPVGIAVDPASGALWASVNERDGLGDNLPPDYITRVRENGFYGWPWFYIGGHPDPRHPGKHPELRDRVIVPDVLIQPHNASLQMVFYVGEQFPRSHRGDIFAAQHGSWNRSARTGYEVIRVLRHGSERATGEYEDFLSGFVTEKGDVWGRPVGVTVAADGSLLVSDDAGDCIWRVRHGKP